jgi:hypothetical protein
VDAKIKGIWCGMGKTSLTSDNLQVLQSLHYCNMPNATMAMHIYFIICTKKICLNQYLKQ